MWQLPSFGGGSLPMNHNPQHSPLFTISFFSLIPSTGLVIMCVLYSTCPIPAASSVHNTVTFTPEAMDDILCSQHIGALVDATSAPRTVHPFSLLSCHQSPLGEQPSEKTLRPDMLDLHLLITTRAPKLCCFCSLPDGFVCNSVIPHDQVGRGGWG